MIVQAQAADALLDRDLEGARSALRAVDNGGRQALGELRSLLGVLRERDDVALERAPQPGVADLPALVGDACAAGVAAELRIEGEPMELGSGVALAVYRIAQEALTNVVKHARGSPAEVVLVYGEGEISVLVTDRGPGAQRSGVGHGLIGMRERAAAHGGSVEAGERPEGGFAVVARLPTRPGA
jgi:signal transduction histidine kinase